MRPFRCYAFSLLILAAGIVCCDAGEIRVEYFQPVPDTSRSKTCRRRIRPPA